MSLQRKTQNINATLFIEMSKEFCVKMRQRETSRREANTASAATRSLGALIRNWFSPLKQRHTRTIDGSPVFTRFLSKWNLLIYIRRLHADPAICRAPQRRDACRPSRVSRHGFASRPPRQARPEQPPGRGHHARGTE